jgi:hypothetical protein
MRRRGRKRIPNTHCSGLGSDGCIRSARDSAFGGSIALGRRCCHTAAHDESSGDREHFE